VLITRTKTKYCFLSLLGASLVAAGLLWVAPQVIAQAAAPITVSKMASPNPVQIGQPLTFTIDVGPASPATLEPVVVTDTVPGSAKVTGATQQQFLNGAVVDTTPCTVTSNTVSCPDRDVTGANSGLRTLRVTIEATAEQCGTFTNTAEAAAQLAGTTVPASANFTVEGCAGPNKKPQGGREGVGKGVGQPVIQAPSQTYLSGANTNNAGSVQTGGT